MGVDQSRNLMATVTESRSHLDLARFSPSVQQKSKHVIADLVAVILGTSHFFTLCSCDFPSWDLADAFLSGGIALTNTHTHTHSFGIGGSEHSHDQCA